MEDIKCIFCNKSSEKIVIEENGYNGRKCPFCGLIFISPRPTLSEIISLYTKQEPDTNKEIYVPDDPRKRLYAKHNLKILKKHKKSGVLLEIGAGAGYFLDEAQKDGFRVFGIELNRPKASYINNKLAIPCETTPLNKASFDGKKADIVYHCNVISHFYDPISEFKKMNNRLKDNGILVFQTSNLGDIKEKYYSSIPRFQYPDHLFFFTEGNLNELLKLSGFELLKIYRYSTLELLLTINTLEKIIKYCKGKNNKKGPDELKGNGLTTKSSSAIGKIKVPQLFKYVFNYFIYLIHYKVGYIMPKKQKPQTIIIIARKQK